MRWTVVWVEEAGAELQRVLQNSRLAQQLAKALLQLDVLLAANPERLGESREGIERI